MKTLNEVVDLTGMSRRVIQEYEKAKLAKTPTTRNKYGHLLYDKAAIDRLWQIRFFRELGYSKKQMKAVFDDPQFDRKEALKKQLELLNEKKKS